MRHGPADIHPADTLVVSQLLVAIRHSGFVDPEKGPGGTLFHLGFALSVPFISNRNSVVCNTQVRFGNECIVMLVWGTLVYASAHPPFVVRANAHMVLDYELLH